MHTLEKKSLLVACVLAGLATASTAQFATVGYTGMVVSPTCVLAVSALEKSDGAVVVNAPTKSTFLPENREEAHQNGAGFTLQMSNCAATAPVAPMVSMTAYQAMDGNTRRGLKSRPISLEAETVGTVQKISPSIPMFRAVGAESTLSTEYVTQVIYIPFRPIAADTGSETTPAVSTTVTIYLNYL